MPDVKISELVGVVTEESLDKDNDLLVVVDASAAESKRVVPDQLVKGAGALHDDDFAGTYGGALVRVGPGTYRAIRHNLAGIAAPAAGDDDADGYAVGSLWVDVSADRAWVCVDASTGAAVWAEASVPDLQAVLDAGSTATGSISLDGSITIGADASGFKSLILWESAPGSEPIGVADRGRLYVADVGGATELFYLDSAGNSVQLTDGGALNVPAVDTRPTPTADATTARAMSDADHDRLVYFTDGVGPCVVTVPTGLTPGTTAEYAQVSSGQVQIAAGGGMTLLYDSDTFNPYTAALGCSIVVTILTSTTALLRGDLEAV